MKIKNIVLAGILLLAVLILLISVLVNTLSCSGGGASLPDPSVSDESSPEEPGDSSDESSEESSVIRDPDDDWQLIMVNPDSAVPDDFEVELTTITGNYPNIPARQDLAMQVDSRIVPALEEMFEDAKADGEELFLRASYRTVALQQTYYDWHLNHYKSQGYSEDEAIALTLEYIAYPGKSEHHTGLAVDIISVDWQNSGKEIIETFEEESEAVWLKENAHKYGFILRYPKDKESITEIGYEPWHFRYVGVRHATAIYESGLCFEEYYATLDR